MMLGDRKFLIGLALTLLGLGFQFVELPPFVAWIFVVVGVLVLTWALLPGLAYGRRDVHQVIDWLNQCADYGTTHIQNAQDVRSVEDVTRILEPRWEMWSKEIVEGTRDYCLSTDAKKIEYLDSFPARRASGVNERHAHIEAMVAETVSRLRDLAQRLERARHGSSRPLPGTGPGARNT